MNRLHKVPASFFIPMSEWFDDATNPPTAGTRNLNTNITALMPIKTFTAGGGSSDLCYYMMPIPSDIYRPNGITPSAVWVPASGWSSGYYVAAINYLSVATPFTLLSAGSWTGSLTIGTFTPSADGIMVVTAAAGPIAVADTDNFVQMRFYHSAASSTANTNIEVAGILFDYTAWRAGSNMHPGQRVA